MKKILLAIITAASLLLVTGCGKKNPYDGTEWIRSTSGITGRAWTNVLRFEGNKVIYYEGDINGNFSYGMSEGTCSVKGNEITFENFRDKTALLEEYFYKATVDGNVLSLYSYRITNGERKDLSGSIKLMKK